MTDAPRRIQLKRTRGWRMPPNTVKADRSTEWGNPFRVGDPGVPDAASAAMLFWSAILMREYLKETGKPHLAAMINDEINGVPSVETIKRDLRGKNIACWCPIGQPCHGDVLLGIANLGD